MAAQPPGSPPGASDEPLDSRHESPEQRADRRWGDLLQEVRIAQTGAQIMFGFMLTVAFTPRFATLQGFDRGLYVAVVTCGAVATGTLIAPVGYHRVLAGRHLKSKMVTAVSRLVALGAALLALTVGGALLLLLRVAGLHAAAWLVAGLVMLWFGICWLVLPAVLLRRAQERTGPGVR
ncbi:DUF6328 family protein [Kitasatospora sp. NPDC048540]|uniref:DUF6328 family protein n=1 Tax=unclassified Kitasatospora TaxID=2633591 RepID=UPI00068F775E|nr:DUF6328 family protein [Kitasatospora sp. MBT63]